MFGCRGALEQEGKKRISPSNNKKWKVGEGKIQKLKFQKDAKKFCLGPSGCGGGSCQGMGGRGKFTGGQRDKGGVGGWLGHFENKVIPKWKVWRKKNEMGRPKWGSGGEKG